MFGWFKKKNKDNEIIVRVTKTSEEVSTEQAKMELALEKSRVCPNCGYDLDFKFADGFDVDDMNETLLDMNEILLRDMDVTCALYRRGGKNVYSSECPECGTNWEVEF